jgi:hypothetical protein
MKSFDGNGSSAVAIEFGICASFNRCEPQGESLFTRKSKREADRQHASFSLGIHANGGTSTNVPINRSNACCSGPFPLRKNSPSSICDSRPPEGALG